MKLARTQTPIHEHLALLDFARYLKIVYYDVYNDVRTFCMKVDEFGYEEISTEEFERLSEAASGAPLDFASISDDEFIQVLRSGLSGLKKL